MNAEQIAARMTFNPCVRCGEDVPAEAWAQVRAGVLFAICQGCGCRQLAWLFDRETGEPMFVTDRDLPDHRGAGEPATAAEADARLSDGLPPGPPNEDEEPAPNSPEDIGGPASGWQNTPAEEAKAKAAAERAEKARANLRIIDGERPPERRPADTTGAAVAEARAAKKAAKSKRAIAAADRKLRKLRKAEIEKKQGGFAGLWGKDQK